MRLVFLASLLIAAPPAASSQQRVCISSSITPMVHGCLPLSESGFLTSGGHSHGARDAGRELGLEAAANVGEMPSRELIPCRCHQPSTMWVGVELSSSTSRRTQPGPLRRHVLLHIVRCELCRRIILKNI